MSRLRIKDLKKCLSPFVKNELVKKKSQNVTIYKRMKSRGYDRSLYEEFVSDLSKLVSAYRRSGVYVKIIISTNRQNQPMLEIQGIDRYGVSSTFIDTIVDIMNKLGLQLIDEGHMYDSVFIYYDDRYSKS